MILEENEVEFLDQLDALYKLKIGKTGIGSNKGIAQGSVISPCLSKVFIEAKTCKCSESTVIRYRDK